MVRSFILRLKQSPNNEYKYSNKRVTEFFKIIKCFGGGIGRPAALKMLFLYGVLVRFQSEVQCNDLEISDGTDAKYEMETFEARIKKRIRHKPYRRYIFF
jgi:hypothetical protein